MTWNIDGNGGADWLKRYWDLPPYKSAEFMEWLEYAGLTLEAFRKQRNYLDAVEDGIIVNDEWVGNIETR